MTLATVVSVTNTPEVPLGLGVSTVNAGGVSVKPVKLVEREVVNSTTQNNKDQQKGGTSQQDEVGESAEDSEHYGN